MSGCTIITNDEYKDLILAQQKCGECEDALHRIAEELKEVKKDFCDLLLYITKGKKAPIWEDGKFESYDLSSTNEIAQYINECLLEDGILKIKENKND